MNTAPLKILVTGAGGFIGSHVTELLLAQGHSVRALVRYNSRASIGFLEDISDHLVSGLDIHLGDVTDAFQVKDLVKDCDVVLHLAALIGIPYSYMAPSSYVNTNVSGTLNVLEACRSTSVRRVVVTSTSEVYGTAVYTPIDEFHPLQGQSPYSATKIAADKLAESYYRSFDLPVVVLRPFNTYGPRQSARAVIPTILSQALSGAETIELGALETKRDLTFVEDTARAFALAASVPGIEGQTIHFGSGQMISIGELAELCLETVGSKARIVSASQRMRPANSEVGVLLCEAKRARSLLRWTPETSLQEGLRRTAQYVERNLGRYRPSDYVL